MINDILNEADSKMDKSVEATREEFAAIRAGRAQPSMFNKILVDYYGTPTPLQQLASFTASEARIILISPYDINAMTAIEKAIRESDLGVNPANDGKVLRCAFPELTEDRRKEYIKVAKAKAEDGRVAVRNLRRTAKQGLEKLEKDGEAGKDDVAGAEKRLDSITKTHTDAIDETAQEQGSRAAGGLTLHPPAMTDTPPGAPSAPQKDHGRAGRDLKAAVASAVVLLGAIAASLFFWKPAFMVIVAAAVVVAVWELRKGLLAKDIDLPEQPLMLGGVVMVVVAYLWGAPALVTATAVSALVTMLWLLRRGIDGYVKTATASVFTLIYVPFLGSFVALLLAEGGRGGGGLDNDGVAGIITFIGVTIASDIGGYIAGVLFGKHPMAPVISPKKSWEGFAGSLVFTVGAGWALVVYLLDGDWWVGVCLGLIAVVMATLGDLCESVMKRDLGIKDMSQVIPGHGGLMDRLDSLLATIAPIWLLLHYAVF